MNRTLLLITFVLCLCTVSEALFVKRSMDGGPAPQSRPPALTNARREYTYLEATFAFANDSDRTVKRVIWQCILIYPDTNNELARYTIVTKKKITPHAGAILKKKVAVPLKDYAGPQVATVGQNNQLPDVVQARQVNKVIEISYSDGSARRP